MARLLHLNGPPGIGKSTLARRYAAEHHGVLNCDIDVLRTLIGGWEDDFAGAGGDGVLRHYHRRLREVLAVRPDAVEVTSVDGDLDATYRAVLTAVGATP